VEVFSPGVCYALVHVQILLAASVHCLRYSLLGPSFFFFVFGMNPLVF
jgi:hypothetical protein